MTNKVTDIYIIESFQYISENIKILLVIIKLITLLSCIFQDKELLSTKKKTNVLSGKEEIVHNINIGDMVLNAFKSKPDFIGQVTIKLSNNKIHIVIVQTKNILINSKRV